MEKLDGKSKDIVGENIQKLRELFPEVFTEGKVDFDLTERTLEDFISNIKTDRREDDVLYEILLKYGLSLDLPIDKFRMVNGELLKAKTRTFSTLNSQLSIQSVWEP